MSNTWTYDRSTQQLFDNEDNEIENTTGGAIYAGCGKNQNEIESESKGTPKNYRRGKTCYAEAGPLPAGLYVVGKPFDDPDHLDPYVMKLTPDLNNKMYGREGFYIHGDSKSHPRKASDGCIVMPKNMREAIGISRKRNHWEELTLKVA